MKPTFTASVVCMDPLNLENEISVLRDTGITDLHIDVMDGQFVPRLGMYPEQLTEIKKNFPEIKTDVHLLIDDPTRFIDSFSMADLIIVHAENNKNLYGCISKIKSHGKRVGIGLNIATSISTIEPVMCDVDLIMLMGFSPGILNQPLWPGLYSKIKNIKDQYPNVDIMVDGGVKMDTMVQLFNSGATHLVCGSSTIYKTRNIQKNIEEMRSQFNGL